MRDCFVYDLADFLHSLAFEIPMRVVGHLHALVPRRRLVAVLARVFVRVELQRQPAEGRLDLGEARVGSDAQLGVRVDGLLLSPVTS